VYLTAALFARRHALTVQNLTARNGAFCRTQNIMPFTPAYMVPLFVRLAAALLDICSTHAKQRMQSVGSVATAPARRVATRRTANLLTYAIPRTCARFCTGNLLYRFTTASICVAALARDDRDGRRGCLLRTFRYRGILARYSSVL